MQHKQAGASHLIRLALQAVLAAHACTHADALGLAALRMCKTATEAWQQSWARRQGTRSVALHSAWMLLHHAGPTLPFYRGVMLPLTHLDNALVANGTQRGGAGVDLVLLPHAARLAALQVRWTIVVGK